eukprot:gene19128-22872_t
MAHSGTVKRWKGSFGFIAPDEGGDDIFVHQTVIKVEGFRCLVAEEKVTYDLETDDKGKSKAINLQGPNGGPLKGLWKEDETPLTGTVARWRTDKGFGFIKPDEEGEDIFVHSVEHPWAEGALPVVDTLLLVATAGQQCMVVVLAMDPLQGMVAGMVVQGTPHMAEDLPDMVVRAMGATKQPISWLFASIEKQNTGDQEYSFTRLSITQRE